MNSTSARRSLGRQLRALRKTSFPTGNALAGVMGWSQSRVSKLETGRKIASEYEINAWTRAVGADERTAEHLRQLRQSALMERLTTDPSDVGSRGDDKPEPELHFRGRSKLDASVRMVAEYHPSVIPLLLSTGQHAVELARRLPPFLETDELPGSALNELALWRTRSQDILYSPTCRVEIILNEAALHTRLGSLAVTVAQLDRLLELCAMQMVDIGIIPATQPRTGPANQPLQHPRTASTGRAPRARPRPGPDRGRRC